MKDESKTKIQLIDELRELRKIIGELVNYQKEYVELTNLTNAKDPSRYIRDSKEKFLKTFLQNAIPMSLTTSKGGFFVEINEVFQKFTGFKRNEIIGNTATALELITEEQKTIIIDKLNKRGLVENLILQVKLKNGKLIDVLFNTAIIRLGKKKYFLTVMANITELKRVKKAQREKGQRLCHLPIDNPMPWFIN